LPTKAADAWPNLPTDFKAPPVAADPVVEEPAAEEPPAQQAEAGEQRPAAPPA